KAGAAQRGGAATPITSESWHHLAVVAGTAEITLYLDGVPAASLSTGLPALNGTALLGGDTAAAAAPASAPAPSGPRPAAGAADAGGDGASAVPATPAAPAPVASSTAAAGFAGDIDELQLAKTARPAGFIRAAAIGQGGDQGKLISFSLDE